MTISAEHRSKFAALHRQLCRLEMTGKSSIGTINPKQTNKQKSSSQETLFHFNQTWHKASLSYLFKKASRTFPRGDNSEILKIHWQNLKLFFSKIIWPISTELSTKYHWMKGIQDCSNEGRRPYPRSIITN